jgi:Tfp pilus assembly protein PilN
VKPVNLLPQKHRPAAPTGERSGSAYILLGALGALLACVVLYVMTANSVTTKNDQIAEAREETAKAEAKTRHLQPFGDFSTVAQTRVGSVRQQAQGRVDWERLVREIAHVLPDGTWLTSADAAVDPSLRTGGTTTDEEITGPSIQLLGCAHDQADVAVMLVRLRRITGATDVRLAESKQGDTQTTAGTGGDANPEDCGMKNGKPNYSWNATVLFDSNVASSAGGTGAKVPARLGGGS